LTAPEHYENQSAQKERRIFYHKKNTHKGAQKPTIKEETRMILRKELLSPSAPTNFVYFYCPLTPSECAHYLLLSVFYTHHQTVARKGPDEVCSMMYRYCREVLQTNVRELDSCYDSCAGKIKNYAVSNFFHFVIHVKERSDTV
jgi:hypothetical protein